MIRSQVEAIEKIIEQFAKDYNCTCGSVYDFENGVTWFMVVDPKTSTYIRFPLKDKDTEDLGFMIRTKESLYDTLVRRYNER